MGICLFVGVCGCVRRRLSMCVCVCVCVCMSVCKYIVPVSMYVHELGHNSPVL